MIFQGLNLWDNYLHSLNMSTVYTYIQKETSFRNSIDKILSLFKTLCGISLPLRI